MNKLEAEYFQKIKYENETVFNTIPNIIGCFNYDNIYVVLSCCTHTCIAITKNFKRFHVKSVYNGIFFNACARYKNKIYVVGSGKIGIYDVDSSTWEIKSNPIVKPIVMLIYIKSAKLNIQTIDGKSYQIDLENFDAKSCNRIDFNTMMLEPIESMEIWRYHIIINNCKFRIFYSNESIFYVHV